MRKDNDRDLGERNDLPLFSYKPETMRQAVERMHKNRKAFDKFHRENPHVYRKLVSMARTLKAHGRRKYAIKTLYEVIRWQGALQTNAEDFKLSNNHAPFYARLIMTENSDLDDFFNLRDQTYG